MAHEENFYGNVLRLSAFLRIVDSAPQRPSRCRRRRDPSPEDNDKHDFDCTLTHTQSITSSTNEPCSILQKGHPRDGDILPLVDDGSEFPYGGPVQDRKSQRTGFPSNQDDTSVRTPKVRRAKLRIKRHLPVNELALVRTSTVDGLPDRAEEEISESIAEFDPIEDSQLNVLQPNPKIRLDPGPCQRYPKRYSKRFVTTQPIRTIDFKSKCHNALSQTLDASALSDGFNGVEKSLPPRAKPRREATKDIKAGVTMPVHGSLDLITGELPTPMLEDFISPRGLGNMSGSSTAPDGEITRGDNALQPCERQVHLAQLRRTATEAVVQSQLASISAPARNDDSSESSSRQGEDDSDGSSYHDDTAYEDLQHHSMDVSELDYVEYPEVFEEFQTPARMLLEADKLQLNVVSGFDEDFWTQYGELEG